ncbi:MAG TPA: hypothetical protein VFG69_10410 [Nannocystaceae bacterium]|nr:hypothetical protein [Nannocystaceae bacterium]
MLGGSLRRLVAGALFATALGIPLSLVAGGGCLTCTEDVCGSRLVVTIREPETAALAPGAWEFTFVLDDGEPLLASCEIGEDSRSASCDGELDISAFIVGDPDDPFTRFHVDIDGGIDSGTEELPEVVDLTVVHDGMVVFDDRLEPHYGLVKPERCDADCFADYVDVFVER